MLSDSFVKLKSNLELNGVFSETIQRKHNAVRGVIENIDPSIKTKLIGSLQRNTRIQPMSDEIFDIDILVILGEFTQWTDYGGVTAQAALQKAYDVVGLSKRYSSMNPVADEPVITFSYEDNVKVELVPAYLDNIGQYPNNGPKTVAGRGYWIPKNGHWDFADYDYEAQYITTQNKICGGHLIPIIKMLKAIKRRHFNQVSSFHLEIIASYVIPSLIEGCVQNGKLISYSELISDFFYLCDYFFDNPVRILGSCSPHINTDLLSSQEHKNKFRAIASHCNAIKSQTSEYEKIKKWKVLFGDSLPLS